MGKRIVALAASVAALASAGCYDSSWGQAKQSQQNVAQARMPERLHGTSADDDEKRPFAARQLRVRVHATPRYAAEVHDWPKRLDDTLDDVNAVLVPTAGVKLVVAEASEWSPRAPDDSLRDVLDELARADPGDDVDFVVGLVASVPRFELSFHELGMGEIPGKHVVLRAMNDARELDEIVKGFPDLSDAEHRKLHAARTKHKNAAVFLHEVGHALGLVHEPDAHTIMSPTYDPKVDGFDPAAADIVRMSLEHRREDATTRDERAYAKMLADTYRRTAASWIPAERDHMLAWLDRFAAPAPTPTTTNASAVVAPPPSDDAPPLPPADRALFESAARDRDAGRAADAWSRAKPLFAKYPDVLAVQTLRCDLATKLLDWKEARRECERVMELSSAQTKSPAKREKR